MRLLAELFLQCVARRSENVRHLAECSSGLLNIDQLPPFHIELEFIPLGFDSEHLPLDPLERRRIRSAEQHLILGFGSQKPSPVLGQEII